jgi:hypothetical protein
VSVELLENDTLPGQLPAQSQELVPEGAIHHRGGSDDEIPADALAARKDKVSALVSEHVDAPHGHREYRGKCPAKGE